MGITGPLARLGTELHNPGRRNRPLSEVRTHSGPEPARFQIRSRNSLLGTRHFLLDEPPPDSGSRTAVSNQQSKITNPKSVGPPPETDTRDSELVFRQMNHRPNPEVENRSWD
jgi:hypothetical protein